MTWVILAVASFIGVVSLVAVMIARHRSTRRLVALRPDRPILQQGVALDGQRVTAETIGILALYPDEVIFVRQEGEPVRIPRAGITDTQKARSSASFGNDGGVYGERRGQAPEFSLRIDWKDAAGARSMIWAMNDPMPWLRVLLS